MDIKKYDMELIYWFYRLFGSSHKNLQRHASDFPYKIRVDTRLQFL